MSFIQYATYCRSVCYVLTTCVRIQLASICHWRPPLSCRVCLLQGYLAHKKQPLPRTVGHCPLACRVCLVPASRLRVQDLWFRVQGSGFRVQGSGSRVQGSGFRISGIRIWCLGMTVQCSRNRVQGSGFGVQGSGMRIDEEWFRPEPKP